MMKLVVLFKHPPNVKNFERRYASNLSLLKKMPGVKGTQTSAVIGGPSGDVAYYRILEILFEDFNALDAALTSPEGVAAGKDLINFAGQIVELLFVDASDERAEPTTLTPDHLQAYLDDQQIPAELVFPDAPTPTVPAAAKAMNVEEDQIVKSVLFLVNDKPFLVYGCGTRRVDPRKLAERLKVNRKVVKLADADQVLEITGYPVGTVPPIGLKTKMPAFMDPAVQAYEVVYAGGGGINALLRITPDELQKASRAQVAPMMEDGSPEGAEAES